ncbi:MAG: 30S ribosomal protein S8e [DPANN group archaeon]|nr:30S ribosomal protein S8e [DPANN group archaeon]
MGVWHLKSKRKSTGGKLTVGHKKKKCELGRNPTRTLLGALKKFTVKARGYCKKIALKSSDTINVSDGPTRFLAKIVKVVENKANPQYVKLGVITKGAVLETDKGNVVVTSRPGQDGVLNGKLVK